LIAPSDEPTASAKQADAVAAALAQAHRSEWAFVLSATVRVVGDVDVAEECAQEACLSALLTFVVVIALIAMGSAYPRRQFQPGLFLLRNFRGAVENGLVRSL
jgi:hypothetical protein